MGLSDQEAAAGRIEDHGTQHNARGRDRQEAWLARQGRHAVCTTPRHPSSRLTAQSGTCLGGRSTNAARCTSHRSTLHRPTQRAAPAIAPHCLPRPATAPFAGQAASPTTTALYCPSRTDKQAPAYDRPGPTAAPHTHGSPDKPRGLSIQPCKSEKEEPYICHSSQGRSECLYLRIE